MSLQLFNRLEVLDYLIQGKKTGAPAQLAYKLNISKRALYDFLNIMKDLGAPIKYDKVISSYYYEEQGQFHIRFKKVKYYQVNLPRL